MALGIAALAAGVTAFAVYLMYGSMIEAQQRRNNNLRAAIRTLDHQIEEINRDRKSTRLNSSHRSLSRMPSSA